MNSKKLRLASATIGASALVGMGALTVALSSDNDTGTIVSDPEITLGETTTSSTAVSADQFPCGGPFPMLVRVTAEPVRVAATVTVSLGASEPFIPAPGGSP